MKVKTKFYLILVFIALVVLIALPREDKILSAIGIKDTKLKVRQGLDLQGGASLLYQADLSKTASADRAKAVAGVVDVLIVRAVMRAVNRAVIRAVMRAVKRSRRSQLAPCEQAR